MATVNYGRFNTQSSFRSDYPLSEHQIERYAPSVLATEPHGSRGERYAFIPTIEVLDGLKREGFLPYEVRQTRVKDYTKREFTKHLVRLRHADVHGNSKEIPEIVLVNSHDGSSSYQLIAGIFRFVCSNGLIAGDISDEIRIRHSGNIVHDVIEGSFRVLDNVKEVEGRIDTYKSITLSDNERSAFALSAAELRWGSDENGNSLAPIHNVNQLIRPRRFEDQKSDLYSVFNVVQENLIKGGLSGRSASNRRTRTREVGGVNENVKLNRALWTLADQLAKFKLGEENLIAA